MTCDWSVSVRIQISSQLYLKKDKTKEEKSQNMTSVLPFAATEIGD